MWNIKENLLTSHARRKKDGRANCRYIAAGAARPMSSRRNTGPEAKQSEPSFSSSRGLGMLGVRGE